MADSEEKKEDGQVVDEVKEVDEEDEESEGEARDLDPIPISDKINF